MAKRDIKSRLGASLQAETQAVRSRFDRADAVLGKDEKRPRLAPVPDPSAEPAARVVRDSFTMPSFDYDLIAAVKQRCLKSGVSVTKSEVLRAGLNALIAMPEGELRRVVEALQKVKTGRPPGK
jgi:hypothetical protein